MKQLLTLLCVAFFFCSCSTLRKSINKFTSNTDSAGVKSSSLVDVNKVDTTTAKTTSETDKKVSDSSYKKTTVVREYYTDEFDFGGDEADTSQAQGYSDIRITPIDPNDYLPSKLSHQKGDKEKSKETTMPKPKKNPGVLLYKETVTIEEGSLVKLEDKKVSTEEKKSGVAIDSTAKNESQASQVSNSEAVSQSNKFRQRVLPGIGISLYLLIVIYVCWRTYREKFQ